MRMYQRWFIVIYLSSLWPIAQAEENALQALKVGIFPRRNAEVTVSLFRPMIEYLSAKLERPVELITSKNFTTFWEELKAGRYDVAHMNQYHYIMAHQQMNYKVILKIEEYHHATIAGALLVRKDSGIKTIADLKGKKIVFGGGPKAMQSYIIATYLLRQGGLQAGDYEEQFAKNPPNAIMSAYYHQADAAGTGDRVFNLPMLEKQIDVNQLQFLARGEQLPQLPWVVRGDMEESLSKQIQLLLADLKNHPQGQKILEQAHLTGLLLASDEEYDPHRKIIQAVYGEQY